MEGASELLSRIDAAQSIVLSTHVRPDGDALGSSGAMYHFIRSRGRRVRVVLDEGAPDTLSFVYRGVDCMTFRDSPDEAASAISSADLIISLDYNVLRRSGRAEDAIRSSSAFKILIDHHVGPERDAFGLVFSETEISSASELVYRIFTESGWDYPSESARCLMTGMTTDTNNFANSVYPSTFRMASDLMARGVDREEIVDLIQNHYRPNRVEAISWLLQNRLKMRSNGIASIVIRRDDWHRFGLKDGELESLVNIPLTVDGINYSLTLREDVREDVFHVSLRSRKGFSARGLAVAAFHGGGHEQASGGSLRYPDDIAAPEEAELYVDKLAI